MECECEDEIKYGLMKIPFFGQQQIVDQLKRKIDKINQTNSPKMYKNKQLNRNVRLN